jgi:hypothetical protein
LTGDELMIRARLHEDIKSIEELRDLVAGDKSPTERNTLAAAAQTFYIPLKGIPFISGGPKTYLLGTIPSSSPEMLVKFKSLATITQTDGSSAPTGTITSCSLVSHDYHVAADERKAQGMRAHSGYGITYRVLEMERQKAIQGSGVTQITVALDQLRGSAVEIMFTLRTRTAIEATSFPTTTQEPSAFNQITSWEVKTGGTQLVDLIDDKYTRNVVTAQSHSGLAGDFIYTWPFSLKPEDYFISAGHKTFASMSTPQLIINLPTLAAESQIDVWLMNNNLWTLAGGELKRVFA